MHRLLAPLHSIPLAALLLAGAPFPTPAGEGIVWGPWHELRPFDHPSGAPSVAEPHAPERELKAMRRNGKGPLLEREFTGKGGGVITWRTSEYEATAADPLGDQVPMDFTRGLDPALRDRAVAFLHRTIDAEVAREVWVLVGSDDGMRLWLNGELLFDAPVARAVREGEHKLVLPLEAGRNHLLVKVGNGGGAWGFQLVHDPARLAALRLRSEHDVDTAIERGIEYLLRTQYPDGSWGFMTGEYRNGQTALALYTLLKSHVAPQGDAVQRALGFLRSRPPRKTYSAAVQLMAFGALRDPALHDEMEAMVEFLVDAQNGGFAYPHGAVDLSNTQYAALGLFAAHRAGIRVRPKVWTDLAEHILAYQHEDGGFGYHRQSGPSGSMTAAGLTVLGACREVLAAQGGAGGRMMRIDKAMRAGADWLARRWTVRENPGGSARWTPYFLYGLERVGAFGHTTRIGLHDWYWDCMTRLLDTQGKDGQWGTPYGESEPNTCFALLCLGRATADMSGAGSRSRIPTYANEGEDTELGLRAAGDTPLTVWISSFGERTTRDYSWPANAGGGLRVKRIEYTIDGEVVETVLGEPEEPLGIERFEARLTFPRVGHYELGARAVLTTAPPETRDVVIEAAPVRVRIRDRVDEETISYATDTTRNLLVDARAEARASSQQGSHGAERAVDDRLATCWLSADEEAVPVWTLELKRAVRADTLLVSQARPKARQSDHAARFTRLEVIVNKRRKSAFVVETTADPRRKTEIPFGKVESVRHLEIRILDRVPGRKLVHAVGLAEVELQLRGARRDQGSPQRR